MAKRNARVILNRRAVDGVRLAIADGTSEVGKTIIRETKPLDQPPYGEGLVDNGGTLTYVDGKKVDGWALDGTQPRKPRAAKTPKDAIVTIAGWGFPMRFAELGTTRQPPRPRFAPARDRVEPRIPGIMARAAKYRIARLRG